MESSSTRVDDRDRHDRTARLALAWESQYDALVDAYLQFRYERPSLAPLDANIIGSEDVFSIDVVDIFGELQIPSQHVLTVTFRTTSNCLYSLFSSHQCVSHDTRVHRIITIAANCCHYYMNS